jgi:hypothetical protein
VGTICAGARPGIGEKRVFRDSNTHVLPAPPTPKIKKRYSF